MQSRRFHFRILLVIATFIAIPKIVWSQDHLYVSISGNDSNSGTIDSPFATLQKALICDEAYRNTNRSLTIHLAQGNYYLTKTIDIRKPYTRPIIVIGEGMDKSRLIGGTTISGWKKYKDNIFQAQVPHAKANNLQFEQLYVNGHYAQQARTPNQGYIYVQGFDNDKAAFLLSNLKKLTGLTNPQLRSTRFELYEKWDVMNWRPVSISGSHVSFIKCPMKPWNKVQKKTRCVIYNSPTALDTQGEWYFNAQSETLFYIPKAGENINNLDVIIPTINQIIKIDGQKIALISNLSFQNIGFECTSHLTPDEGEGPEQAAAHIESAIEANYAKDLSFINCKVSLTGGYGITLGEQCENCIIQQCLLTELGAGGIKIGTGNKSKDLNVTNNNIIDNNIIRHLGKHIPSGVGILVLNARDNKITHNDISDLYYTGISLGWTWGFNDNDKYNVAVNNEVSFNRIYNIGQRVLSDLAGIYTLGESAGTVISNNVIFNIRCADYGGCGIYADEGSSHLVIKNNLVYNCSSCTFQQNYGRDNLITNNIFAYGGDYQLHLVRTDSGLSFTFRNNIVLYSTGRTLSGSLSWIEKNKFMMNYNLYWNENGKLDLADKDFNTWRTFQDYNSVETNPLFIDPMNGNFNFLSETAARKVGFIPFDYSKAGIYNRDRQLQTE